MADMDKKLANKKSTRILWVDMEMGGLDPLNDIILEVAAIVTDWDFKELAVHEAIVHQSDVALKNMNEWCVNQHSATGLTQRSRESKLTLEKAESDLLEFIDNNFEKDIPVLLAGNSIHQDRRFIAANWPKLDARLHYRMLDVSAWKVVFEAKFKKRFAKPEEHRALGDIRGSIMELKYYLAKVKV